MPAAANACRRAGVTTLPSRSARRAGSRSSRRGPRRPVAQLGGRSPVDLAREHDHAPVGGEPAQHCLERGLVARPHLAVGLEPGQVAPLRARLELPDRAHQRDDHRGGDRGHGDRRLRDHDEHLDAGRQRRRRRVGQLLLERLGGQQPGRQVARAEAAARARVERDHAVARAVDGQVPLELRRRRLGIGLVEAEEASRATIIEPTRRRAGRSPGTAAGRGAAARRAGPCGSAAGRCPSPGTARRRASALVMMRRPSSVVCTWSRHARPMFQSSVTSWSSKTM